MNAATTFIRRVTLAVLFSAVATPLLAQENLVINGSFPGDSIPSGWSTFVADWLGTTATYTVADGTVSITGITNATGESWHVQFFQLLSQDQIGALEIGETYVISFDASSPVEGRPLNVFFGEDGGGFVGLGVKNFALSTDTVTYSFEATVSAVFGAMKLAFEAGKSNDDLTIANVSLRKKVDNVIVGGEFAGDSVNGAWSTFVADWLGTTADFSVIDGALNISGITNATGESWHVQFNQILSQAQIASLETGAKYGIMFDAASNVEGRPLNVFFGEDGGGFVALGVKNFALTTEMMTYSFDVDMTAVFGAMKLSFEAGKSNDNVILDNIYVYKKTAGTPPAPIPTFGENRILFVDGPDLRIPVIHGEVVEDVVEAGNKVHKITGGAWYQFGYFWDKGGLGGVDFSANMERVDTVYFRIRINPADHTADDTGDRRTGALVISDVTNGTNSNLQWGISWPFPEEAYDNKWHEYAIPLPKPTIAAHDSALKDLAVDGTPLADGQKYNAAQKRWRFDTAWNGSIDVSPNDPDLGGDPEWNKLGRIGIALGNDRSGTFYLDDVYVGSAAATDLSTATQKPDQPSGVQATASNGKMNLSWSHNTNSNIFAYELYYSGEAITDLAAPGVNRIGAFLADDTTAFSHEVRSPHPVAYNQTYHYALAPTTVYGISDSKVFATTQRTAMGEIMPYIFEISPEIEAEVINVLDSGTLGDFSFENDTFKPFVLQGSEEDEKWGGVADASAKVWMGFGRLEGLNTFYIYAEVMDDNILAGPENDPAGMYGTTLYPRADDATTWIPTIAAADNDLEWNYYLKDQLKFNFGTYGVNFVSGTTNKDRARGENPDYFLALQPYIAPDKKEDGPQDMLVRFWVTEPEAPGADADYKTLYYNSNHLFTYSSIYENIMDGETRVGWKALVAFDASDLQVAVDESSKPIDAAFEFPEEDDIKYIPMMIELSDKDSGDGGNWWEVPSHVFRYPTAIGGARMEEWTDNLTGIGTVAMSGRFVPTSTEQVAVTQPDRFELMQNYPNPFNPATTIRFALPQASEVTLNVYNVVGQRVAVLASGQRFSAGVHSLRFDASDLSSGVYLYEIVAGSFRSTRKMLLVK